MSDLLYRYPLPAHSTPHVQEDCGDPEWCLHEEPTERADLQIQLEPIPKATGPLVDFTPAVAAIGERLDVDTDGMSDYLRRVAGWSATDAAGVRIVFNSPQEFKERRKLPDCVEGVYNDLAIDRPATETGEGPELVGYRHSITIPVSPAHVSFLGIRKLNSILRHELGHGDSGGRFGDVRLYRDFLKKEGVAPSGRRSPDPKVLGLISSSKVVAAAKALGLDELGLIALHRLDKEENHARWFDVRHAWDLNPISRKRSDA
jgi:hypothetical protein